LRDALDNAGVPNWLVTLPGGRIGNFSQAERLKIFGAIRVFLDQYVPGTSGSASR
jgi:hypothetical protein